MGVVILRILRMRTNQMGRIVLYSLELFDQNTRPIRQGYTRCYCLTKISIRAKRSISRVFSLFIVPSPFFVHCPYKGRIDRADSVLTGQKPY